MQAAGWQDPLIAQFLEMGIARSQASLGLAYITAAQANQSEVSLGSGPRAYPRAKEDPVLHIIIITTYHVVCYVTQPAMDH